MTNAEWLIKNGIQFKKIEWRPIPNSGCESIGYYDKYGHFNECYKDKILSDCISESILIWLDMEHKEPILDDVEKQYLSAVIKPFRKRVKHISKEEDRFDDTCEFIHIKLSDEDIADFPDFKANTMYKGMEIGRKYSLEELGL